MTASYRLCGTRVCLVLALCLSSLGAQATVESEGPHLFHLPDGSVEARWIEKGLPRSKRFGKGKPIILPKFKDLLGEQLVIETHRPPKGTWPMPPRLLALSDVEGEYSRMRKFLRNHGVIDAQGRWSFGKGHVVTVGDMVDRGVEVTETLLLLHRLEREARQAGGRLHFIIGNHEAMMMGGDIRYTAPKYTTVAARLGVTVPGLLGADTEIGRWLRQQNTMVRIGDIVFVHAGITPLLVDAQFDFDRFNTTMRRGVGRPPQVVAGALQALVWGRGGPLWYRGYFPEFALEFGPTPTAEQLETTVARLKGSVIVIGHTKVAEVGYIDAGRRVLAIDTTWTADAIVRGVIIEKDRVRVLGITRELKDRQLPRRTADKDGKGGKK